MNESKEKAEKEEEERQKKLKDFQERLAHEQKEHAKVAREQQAALVDEMKKQEEVRKVESQSLTKLNTKLFAEKKAKYAKEFEHVWIGGDTQTRIMQWTMPDPRSVELLQYKLFEDNLVSDCEVVNQGMSRTFLRDGKEVILDTEYQMICATGDDRIDDLKKMLALSLPQKNHDLVATTPITGNINYFNYINYQTQTKLEIENKVHTKHQN